MTVTKEIIDLVRAKAGSEIPIEEIEEAFIPAKRKLDDLINRFGTDNGQRLKPRYLAQLIIEQIYCSRFAAFCRFDYEQKRKEQSTQKLEVNCSIPNC